MAQTLYQASEPYPLVHITPWSPSIAPGEALAPSSVASRRNSFIDSPLSSGGRPLVVFAASRQNREDDARDLVGQRHRRQLELVFDGLALEQPIGPNAQGVVVPLAMAQRRASAHHQELAQV